MKDLEKELVKEIKKGIKESIKLAKQIRYVSIILSCIIVFFLFIAIIIIVS